MMRHAKLVAAFGLCFAVLATHLMAEDGGPEAPASVETARPRKFSPLNFGFDLQYHFAKHPDYALDRATGIGTRGGGVGLNFEWLPITRYGKAGIGLGLEAFWVTNVPLQAGGTGSSTLYAVQPTFTYHADFMERQFAVPYLRIGPSFYWALQQIDGVKSTLRETGVQVSIGIQILLNTFEKRAGQMMDSVYGINATYLLADYTRNNTVAPNSRLASTSYRVGLRFEF